MKFASLIAATAAAATLAGALPASAERLPAGEAQLARSIGVTPGAYTLSELTLLKTLKAEDSSEARDRIAFIQKNAGDVTTRDSVSGPAQLSLSAGVTPGTLDTNELQRLNDARRENDAFRADYILSGERENSQNAAAKAQLAGSLGVDADAYTLAQLVALNSNRMNDND
ncbi:hypothetical protein [Profundibacterium mesophilum]|uniref:DUF4142 domain-containing protein n=1 Tax=Profundibacterium mesophilum KAUST100406-0324 TaxID=1037889 RepID=A0A921TD25_9RHOB|nr:hypothetical protein [Profundibacterium mesophilum]KAF0675657.1 hypothetical protein PMES_01991 [Profundibacterium mesophilum KAUST100406-0324]